MKGLLLKDWYLTKKYARTLLIVIAAFTIGGVFTDDLGLFVIYPCIMSGILSVTMLAYDDREKWMSYAQVLPVTRAQYVTGKYLFGALIFAAYLLLSTVGRLLAGMDGEVVVALLAFSFSLGLVGPAVTIPFIIRFGPERGRIVLFALFAVAAGVTMWLMSGNAGIGGILSRGALSEGAFCLASLALYVLSWRLSIFLYNRREL